MTTRERTRMRVLLATDGSNDAKTAVGWLRQFPLPAGHEILIVHRQTDWERRP
jgi:nucleotide-binding universal stress UspA family protein